MTAKERVVSEVALTQHRIVVLLVDDQPIIGEAVRRMLAEEPDIEFHFCQDPLQAVKTANRISPTVILQDLVMPGLDGLALVRYFRANRQTKDVPLIVLSSQEEARTKAEAFALGANDYMVKLPDRLEVLARIRYHSKGYINLLERNEAYAALLESQKQLEIRNRFIRHTFGRYLSDEIVDTILETPEGLQLGGEKRLVTILMADLRGFTAITERLPGESVVSMINIYLEVMTDIIFKYQGTIDEFIGDGILAVFGAPVQREDDVPRAVACALEMQLGMKTVNERNVEAGYPSVAIGIGLQTGDVVVGNIGSRKRTKYGVVGRTVNLASRIESYTVGGQILVSPSVVEACHTELRIDDRMLVMPKGVKEPMEIYELGGIGAPYNLQLPEKQELKLPELARGLLIRFSPLSGKHATMDGFSGVVERLAGRYADVRAKVVPERLTDLRVTLYDEGANEVSSDIYAKVIGTSSDVGDLFRICFTCLPPEAERHVSGVTNRTARE